VAQAAAGTAPPLTLAPRLGASLHASGIGPGTPFLSMMSNPAWFTARSKELKVKRRV